MEVAKMRSNLLPSKNVQSVLSMQGLVCRSPQLDSSSREEMYYPRDPIRWSTARASPPWYPHVRLDVDVLSLIPQARRTWLDRSRHHDGCGGVDGLDLHEHDFTKPSKRSGRGGGAAAALHLGVVRQLLWRGWRQPYGEGWRTGLGQRG